MENQKNSSNLLATLWLPLAIAVIIFVVFKWLPQYKPDLFYSMAIGLFITSILLATRTEILKD